MASAKVGSPMISCQLSTRELAGDQRWSRGRSDPRRFPGDRGAGWRRERLRAPVIEDEEIGADQHAEQAREATVAARQGEILEEPRRTRCRARRLPSRQALWPSAQASQLLADAGQAHDILPRNIRSKLSFNIRIIRAPVSASLF